MKTSIQSLAKIIVYLFLLLPGKTQSQTCLFDSINDYKLYYDQSGRLNLICRSGIEGFDTVSYYQKLFYNNDSLLEYITDFTLKSNGDTLFPQLITRTYEYSNGLL